MTNEEAIRIAMGLRTDFKCESDTMVDFCNTIIKALKQDTVPFDFELYEAGLMDLPNEMINILDKIRDEILEYIDDLDIATEICDIFNKYTNKKRSDR
jgi:hypothetical protein